MEIHLPRAFDFHLWLIAQAESNELEGEQETAAKLRSLAQLVLDHPQEFEAYCAMRAAGLVDVDGRG